METKQIIFILFIIIIPNFNQSFGQSTTGNDDIEQTFRNHMRETPFYKRNQIEVDEEDVLQMVDNLPAFGVFRDSYFVTGIPLNKPINVNTADAMFQISIRHRITKSRLPYNTFLFITYTQKAFWNIYAKSSPFHDINYNPAIGLGKYIIHNNKFKGTAFLQIEHESNGRDSLDSRSWNMASISVKYFFNPQIVLGLKTWIPIVDGKNNKDLIDHRGWALVSLNYITKNEKWWFSAEFNSKKGSFASANTTLTAGIKVSDKSNQYLYARFHSGTGDSLLDYKQYNINIRVGFCIKPNYLSIF